MPDLLLSPDSGVVMPPLGGHRDLGGFCTNPPPTAAYLHGHVCKPVSMKLTRSARFKCGQTMCKGVDSYCLQSHALQAENATLRGQIQEHQAHAAALQDQAAEQGRTISLGGLQLKQLQSKVGPFPVLWA